MMYPLAVVQTLPRAGSDHTPLLVLIAPRVPDKPRNFRMEPAWFQLHDFKSEVLNHWPNRTNPNILSCWQIQCQDLRRFLKGWGANLKGQFRRERELYNGIIVRLDSRNEVVGLNDLEWRERYKAEKELMRLFAAEEAYWRQRGGEKWILEGDANTSYFHSIANGRRRKKMILSIEDGERILTQDGEIREHILRFYKDLFGSVPDPEIHLGLDMWEGIRRVSSEDNIMLLQPFSDQKIEDTIREFKSNTAPGPDGFSVAFYKCFLDKVKPLIKEMMDDLAVGRLDLSRINYGVIVLLPKILDANCIKQYSPICLINVIFKILTKLKTRRLSKIASKYIAINQTAFIPDRNIHDGVVALHEILHDLKANKKLGIVIKLDFEKTYDKIHWKFLFEVLQRKGFSEAWIL
jgi:hypothetical protein